MIEVECRIHIKNDGRNFLDSFKIKLLNEIQANGSLKQASKNLNISYQHAWKLIEEINRVAPKPVVNSQRGGLHGGGATITEYGLQIIDEYNIIENTINKITKQINVEINF